MKVQSFARWCVVAYHAAWVGMFLYITWPYPYLFLRWGVWLVLKTID